MRLELFTIGYTKKSAEKFFRIINDNKIEIVADVRLYNSTQLAGFSKSADLQYFLKKICGCSYIALKQLAPNPSLFENYKNGKTSWNEYEKIYNKFLDAQANLDFFYAFKNKRICILCAESTPERCHRRLLAEKIAKIYDDVTIVHL